MRRNVWRCPDWCAQDHQCTVRQGSPAGVHRSNPMPFSTAYGSLVAVRNQDLDGRDWLEIHAHARLGRTDINDQEQASLLLVKVDLAIRSMLLPPVSKRPELVKKEGHLR